MHLALNLYLVLYLLPCSHSENKTALKKCLFNTVFRSTKRGDTVVIINNETRPYLWTELVQSERWSFIQNSCKTIASPDFFRGNLKKNVVSMFLIQIKTLEELKPILDNLQSYYIFNSRANFLVTSTTKFRNITMTLSSIFQNLWKVNIYNALVVLPCENNSSKTDLFTWYPYKSPLCQEDFSKFKTIGYCRNGQFQNQHGTYPNKIPDKLKNCPIKIRTVVWPPFVMKPTKRINNTDIYVFKQGFEIALMNAIGESMSLNLIYTLSEKSINWGELYDNGSATGMQAFLLENEADIGLSSQAYTQSRLKFFDLGFPYFFEHLLWCVPRSNTIPAFEKIVDVFSLGSWALSLFALSVFVLLTWCLGKLNSENSYRNFVNCLQNAVGILFGVAIFPFPKTYSIKLLFCFWFIFTVHLNLIYKTSLVSMLANPVYEKQMKTAEEILRRDLRLQFVPTMKRYFDDHQRYAKEILDKWIDCLDLNDCMDRVAYTKDSAILLPKLYLEFVKNKYKSKHGSLIYCFNGNIQTYPGSMLMRKGFPLKYRMNVLIARMISAGLVDQWQKDALNINLTFNRTSSGFEPAEAKVIRSKEQAPAFICLMLGLVVASVVFICELLAFKYRKLSLHRTYPV